MSDVAIATICGTIIFIGCIAGGVLIEIFGGKGGKDGV